MFDVFSRSSTLQRIKFGERSLWQHDRHGVAIDLPQFAECVERYSLVSFREFNGIANKTVADGEFSERLFSYRHGAILAFGSWIKTTQVLLHFAFLQR